MLPIPMPGPAQKNMISWNQQQMNANQFKQRDASWKYLINRKAQGASPRMEKAENKFEIYSFSSI